MKKPLIDRIAEFIRNKGKGRAVPPPELSLLMRHARRSTLGRWSKRKAAGVSARETLQALSARFGHKF